MEILNSDFKEEIESRCKENLGNSKFNFFELIHQPFGFQALQNWFCSQGGSEVDEYGLFKVLKMTCFSISETATWEIFDTFAQDLTISFREFLMIIYLLAAAESGQLKLFLYLHGKTVYQMLAGGDRHDINFERLKRIGRVLKMNENYLSEKGKDLSINYLRSSLNYEQFEVFYFKIFAELDSRSPDVKVVSEEVQEEVPYYEKPPEPKERPRVIEPKKSSKKTGCSGCHSKACNLL